MSANKNILPAALAAYQNSIAKDIKPIIDEQLQADLSELQNSIKNKSTIIEDEFTDFVDNNETSLDDTVTDKDVNEFFYENFNDFLEIREKVGSKLKFDTVRKYFQCKQTSEGYYFTFGDRTCYLSKRKSKNKAWQEFIKNYWYRDENKSFRIEVYKTIFELADNDDMDITE